MSNSPRRPTTPPLAPPLAPRASDNTISEQLFEEFCADHGIPFEPVPRAATRTPDYDLSIVSHRAIAEVKQIEPNDDDLRAQQALDEGSHASLSGEAGKRVRQVITNSKVQIHELAKGICPGLLVIYNNAGQFSVHHTDPMFVLVAMYGHLQARLRISWPSSASHASGEQPSVVSLEDKRFGGKRRVTEADNTSISAVCILYRSADGKPGLNFYHNAFAAQPFDPNWLRGERVRHYVIKDAPSHRFETWSEA